MQFTYNERSIWKKLERYFSVVPVSSLQGKILMHVIQVADGIVILVSGKEVCAFEARCYYDSPAHIEWLGQSRLIMDYSAELVEAGVLGVDVYDEAVRLITERRAQEDKQDKRERLQKIKAEAEELEAELGGVE